jgi:hypothetical protein
MMFTRRREGAEMLIPYPPRSSRLRVNINLPIVGSDGRV